MGFTYTGKNFGVIFLVSVFILVDLQSCLPMSIKEEMKLTEEQQESFDKFKANALFLEMPDYMKTELVLIKYFRYADMDKNKAIQVLKDNLKWRLNAGFEKLSEDDINEDFKAYQYATFVDKLGRGVFYLPTKDWDCSLATSTPELAKKFNTFLYYILEDAYVKGVSNVKGKKESGIVHWQDLHGVEVSRAFSTSCIAMVREVSKQLAARWPLGLQAIYAVNADPFLNPTLSAMKGVLPEKMQSVVHLYDEDDAIWLPELQKFIPEDSFPAGLYMKSKKPQKDGDGGNGGMAGNMAGSMAGGMSMFGQAAPAMGAFGGSVPATNPGGRSAKKGKKKKKNAKKNDDENEDDDLED